ncbi:MAG TPA: BlaI/MecI/CopY family transcriptional regulator [Candidatus Fournierella merdigallinarum]|nr:BlaI/MecI/CopY family transcriptional regulator [Candidatus Fournierella merdigallinarum]
MKLSDAELEIMEKVWEMDGPVTAARLTERLAEKGWKPSTLLTFLARMVNKGALAVEKQGKQNLYRALVSADAYRAGEVRELLGRYYSGSVKSMVAALYDGKGLSDGELAELRAWLEEEAKHHE